MSLQRDQILRSAARWGLQQAADSVAVALAAYGNLLLHWNTRLSLTAIRDEQQLIDRHLLEGLFAAVHHPPAANSLDFGSGTGIPGIPIALCHPQIAVTLAESQRKKAAFLQEAVRSLSLQATVYSGRAEQQPLASFSAVWMRAVDNSSAMLPLAAGLVAPNGHLCLLTTQESAISASQNLGTEWSWQTTPLPDGSTRVLHIGLKM